MNPLTCQIAEKNAETSTQMLICKYYIAQTHKNGVYITYVQSKSYI